MVVGDDEAGGIDDEAGTERIDGPRPVAALAFLATALMAVLRFAATSITDRFAAVDRQLVAHDRRLDTIDRRFDKVDERFEKIDERFDRLETKLDAQFEKIAVRFDRLEARVDGLDRDVTTLMRRDLDS